MVKVVLELNFDVTRKAVCVCVCVCVVCIQICGTYVYTYGMMLSLLFVKSF